LVAADILGYINFNGGYNASSSFRLSSTIGSVAEETFSGSTGGANLVFSTTNLGATSTSEKMRIAASGYVGIGATSPGEKLDVTGNIHASGQMYSNQNILTTGATVDFNNGNMQVLQSVGGSAITLTNLKDGGSYILVVSDATSRTYTFPGCTNALFSPANAPTTVSTTTIYNILKTTISSTTYCYISWSSGYQ
jgi:hypothetical protein